MRAAVLLLTCTLSSIGQREDNNNNYYYTICMSPVTGISSWYFS